MNVFCECPRCGDRALERLKTHAHCVGCLYFEHYEADSETAYHDVRAVERFLEKFESEERELEENQALAS